MEILKTITLVLLAAYGLLVAGSGLQQYSRMRLKFFGATGMFLCGIGLLLSAYLLWRGAQLTIPVTAVSLLVLHVVTIFNGLGIQGKVNWLHQTGRAFTFLILFTMVYYSLN
jgi:hypothetical protein